MNKNIIIVSNGRFGNISFFQKKLAEIPDRFIICCDGAARHLAKTKIKPDIVLGDMDSLEPFFLESFKKKGIKTIEYPVQKNFTDTELALDYALNMNPSAIYIWGASGGRIDHILGNVFLLIKGKRANVNTYLIDEYAEAFLPKNKVIFSAAVSCTVSLLPLTEKVEGITLSGFAYPLNNETLRMGETRGLSNYIQKSTAKINFVSGELLVIRYWISDLFPEAA
ncbi:MAG TPA: thiamine diphosphokinase [Deltaproteobacteria bacterium]|nr:thiamine diphosphokinase [Deltaproteobacteria bacterium]